MKYGLIRVDGSERRLYSCWKVAMRDLKWVVMTVVAFGLGCLMGAVGYKRHVEAALATTRDFEHWLEECDINKPDCKKRSYVEGIVAGRIRYDLQETFTEHFWPTTLLGDRITPLPWPNSWIEIRWCPYPKKLCAQHLPVVGIP